MRTTICPQVLRASAAQGNADAEFLSAIVRAWPGRFPAICQGRRQLPCRSTQATRPPKTIWPLCISTARVFRRNLGKRSRWYLASAPTGNPVGQCNWRPSTTWAQASRRDYARRPLGFHAAADSGSPRLKIVWRFSTTEAWASALDYTEAARWLRLAAERALPAAETNWLTCNRRERACRSTTSLFLHLVFPRARRR